MKNKIKFIVIFVIYFTLIIACTKAYATTGTIAKDTVRLREKASTNSSIVVLLPIEHEVEIIEQDGEWYKIKCEYEGKTYTGYIRQDMLNVEGSSDDQTSNSDTDQENNNQDANTTTENNSQDENTTSENDNQDKNTTSEQNNNEKTSDEVSNDVEITEGTQLTISEKVETRILPLINSSKTETIKDNTEILVTEIIGNWCYVEANNQTGWVMTSKIKQESSEEKAEETTETEEKKEEIEQNEETTETKESSNTTTETKELYVSVTTVNLREEASSSSKILQQLSLNTKVTVIEKVDNTWSKVQVSGITGYIATQYLSENKTEVTSRGNDEIRTQEDTSKSDTNKESQTSSTTNKNDTDDTKSKTETTTNKKEETTSDNKTSSSSSKTTGSDVVAYAKTFIGCKYVYGGTSPSGFDCSGFTQYVYKHFGYSLSRTSSAQRSNGVAVSKSNLKAGDIVCFSGHVGIYIGGNQFIHAENPANGVTISSLSESYYTSTYITARRIIN